MVDRNISRIFKYQDKVCIYRYINRKHPPRYSILGISC